MERKEVEIRLTNKDIKMSLLKKKLRKIGARIKQKERIFYYIIYLHPQKKNDYYIRVRDEGEKITMTVKTNLKNKYVDEYEININDFNEADKILTLLGCKKHYEIHKLREKWEYRKCKEIVFDTYPAAEPYVEIECNNEKEIKEVLKDLDLNTNLKNYLNTNQVSNFYLNEYGIKQVKKLQDLTFTTASKVLGNRVNKNKKLFNERLNKQRKKHIKQINELKKR